MQLIDLVGKRYNRLYVLKRQGEHITPNGNIIITWLCKCDCGNEKIIFGTSLRNGSTKSCGCLLKEKRKELVKYAQNGRRLPHGIAAFNKLYEKYKRVCAIERNLIWELTKENCSILFKENCYWCGIEPLQIMKTKYTGGDYIYNGIDRLNNNIGYTKQNTVSCCGTCNEMKSDRSIKEFINIIHKIANRHKNV